VAKGSTEDNDKAQTGQAYEVIRATKETPAVLEVDGKTMRFPRVRGSMMRVKDRGLAMAIRDQYGSGRRPKVTVTKVNYPDVHDRGHRYFFSMPEMPWKRSKDNGKAETEEEEKSNELHDGDLSPQPPVEQEEKAR
jgi:hypothetical protein